MIDDESVHGQIPMNRLLLADNFQLKCAVPLIKTTIVEQKKKKKPAAESKGRRTAKEIQDAKNAKQDNEPKTIETHAGTI